MSQHKPELKLPPLSLYVHIPWCVRKCPYCDFNSHKQQEQLPEAAYLAALERDLESELALVQGRQLSSIFFGGGTPSLFSAKAISQILELAERKIGFSPDIEITLEANPGTFEQAKFADYRSAGVNRLSIGIQSFQPQFLTRLGRIHSSTEAIKAVEQARAVGFDNFNLDLMHGLPEQTPELALADIEQALALDPMHLSWYQLTIEQNTEFYKQPPPLPLEDDLAEIQFQGEQFLAQAGFEHYEVSAFSKPGKHSRHNLNYWQFGDYIGIGAGAHGKLTDLEQQHVLRRWKTRQPDNYIKHLNGGLAGSESIAPNEMLLEFMMNALRLRQGVELDLLPAYTGLQPSAYQDQLLKLQRQGLLVESEQVIRLTELGQRFVNNVLEAF